MEEGTLRLKEKLEKLRDKLNSEFTKNDGSNGSEVDKRILAISEELDNVILEYMKRKI